MSGSVDETVDAVVAQLARKHDRQRRVATMLLILGAAAMLRRKLSAAITSHRQAARNAAVIRLRAELAAAGVGVEAGRLVVPSRGLDVDSAHAESAAASLAAAWQASAIAATARMQDGGNPYRAVDKTRASTIHRINRTATNEVASAYNDEHGRALKEAADRDPELAAALEANRVVRVWDAVLDRRTCEECDMRDGRIIDAGDEDPPLHVGCRCITTIDVVSARAAA